MSANGNGAVAIYARAEEVQRGGAKLQPIPSYELYKAAREEELRCYRSLCRVIRMHNSGELTKQQTRVLEDMREELCIPAMWSEAELLSAADDTLVSGVAASGILKRREDFFDGVVDIVLDALHEGETAQDDRGALYAPPTKTARTEQSAPIAAHGALRRTMQARMSNATILKNIDKIKHEVEVAGNKLLYANSPEEQQSYRRTLQEKREQLQRLLRDCEGSVTEVSHSSSRVPSEYVM